MESVVKKNSSIIGAILLSLLTLSVFAAEQNMGPESSVRRFQAAVLSRDIAELQRCVVQPIGTPSVAELQAEITQLQSWGAVLQITRTTRFVDHVVVDAQYRTSTGDMVFLAYVLRRDGGRWKVDADQTRTFVSTSFGIR